MTFFDSIQTCFKKSFITTGTASRSEYFYFAAFVYLMTNSLLLLFLLTIIANLDALLEKEGILLLSLLVLFSISVLPASISVTIRRLHDMGKSGANFFIGFIPFIGPFILLYYLVQPTKEDSSYREERANLLDNWNREAEP
ncbi:DUF805 domain-containing protein [Hoylesella nanceiensis]